MGDLNQTSENVCLPDLEYWKVEFGNMSLEKKQLAFETVRVSFQLGDLLLYFCIAGLQRTVS